MAFNNKNETLDKLRSYSTVFSSMSFSQLLQHDDYSFIDAKIKRFDLPKIGKKINTYYDYVQYIYGEIGKQYRNEYIYKNTFINKLLLDEYGVIDTVAINEFRVGNSIADIVMFNGTSKAFEIKTELDSNRRLKSQIAEYAKIFKECYIITHESLSKKYLEENADIGIIELIGNAGSIEMREVRYAKENINIDADTLIRSIRTQEYKNIVENYYGELPIINSFNMFETCKELIKQIPAKQLHELFIGELKKRKSNTSIINTFNTELRQVCFAMNITANMYKELEIKLRKKINL